MIRGQEKRRYGARKSDNTGPGKTRIRSLKATIQSDDTGTDEEQQYEARKSDSTGPGKATIGARKSDDTGPGKAKIRGQEKRRYRAIIRGQEKR